ncbi:NEDD8-conjugating enzyme Ubc12-like isoform X2 [Carex rostrata]
MQLEEVMSRNKVPANCVLTKVLAKKLARLLVDFIDCDISELNLPNTTSICFPNGKDELMNFEISIRPDEGYYFGGMFTFTFQVSPSYPHEPPKVKCKTKVYHPNIDLEGNVCLNILREDWKPVLSINTVIYGLNLLFSQPNDEDPLNHEAAAVLRENPKLFESNVRRAMSGGYVGQTYFTRCLFGPPTR